NAEGKEGDYKNNPKHWPRLLANLWNRMHFVGQVWIGAAAWPAILQYSTYDGAESGPIFGKFQRMPPEHELNNMLQRNDKTPDLAWVYTVIAGVLNILVIYDAIAGPALLSKNEETPELKEAVKA